MNLQSILELFEYNYWAFDRVWQSINQLDDAKFVSDLGYSFGSIRNQIIHLISSHQRWLARLQLTGIPPHLDFADLPTRTLVKEKWNEARDEFLDYVYSLDRANLEVIIPYRISSRSIDTANSRWEILLHLVNHSTDHRSQILTLLNTKFEIDTPEQISSSSYGKRV
jgi:uncharacterized damage-inducible protein DinB